MRVFFLIFTLIYTSITQVHGQVTLSGYVKDDSTGAEIEGAIITVLSKDSNDVLAYTTAKDRGYFSIDFTTDANEYVLKASMLGYEFKSILLAHKSNQELNIRLKQQVTQLKEVLIKPPRVVQRSDTISYDVSSFATGQDRSIGDVLRKLPGIDVQPDGSILYNGKAINRFYIEGLDLLENKYGLAVNNVSFKDIASVEVLEDHQPIKALKATTPSDRAGLNLKLKNTSKARWVGNSEVAAGAAPVLWETNLLALKIAASNQSLNLIKSNNTGQNISSELKSHTLEDLINGLDNDVGQSNLIENFQGSPPIKEERSLFNRTLLASGSNMRLLKNDYQLRYHANYLNNRLNYSNQSDIVYYLPGNEQLQIFENNNATSQQNRTEAIITLKKNNDLFYLNNKTRVQLSWEDTFVNNTGTVLNNQRSNTPYHLLENDFNWIKIVGKRTLKLNSFNHYNFLPQKLIVTQSDEPLAVIQAARLNTFFSHTNVAYGQSFQKWTVDYKAGIRANLRRLNSGIQNLSDNLPIQDSLNNNLQMGLLDYYIRPVANHTAGKINLSLEFPLHYYTSKNTDRIERQAQKETHLFFNPEISFRYKFTPLLTGNLKAGLSSGPVRTDRLNEGYILRNYRYIELGSPILSIERNQLYSAGLSYRSPVKSLFMDVSGTYMQSLLNQLNQHSFSGLINVGEVLLQNNQKSILRLSSRLSKGIDDWDATASLAFNYTATKGELLQQGKLLNNEIGTLMVQPGYTMKISQWGSFDYNGDFSRISLLVSNTSFSRPLIRINQHLGYSFLIGKKYSLKAGIDHLYNELSDRQAVSIFFADVGIRYLPSKNIEINLDCTNIFNKNIYAYTAFDNASYNSSLYIIRPINVLAGVYFRW